MSDFGGGGGGYDEAAQIIAQATKEATAVQKSAYEKNLEAMYPWLTMGKTALGTYGSLLGLPVSSMNYPSSFDLQGGSSLYPQGGTGTQVFGDTPSVADSTAYIRQTPGYQFELNQGLESLGRYASARGLDYSGAQMRGVTSYGQGLADKYYTQYMNQLAGLYGAGQTGANQIGQTGVQTGTNIANTTMSGANALAQAAIGSSQAQSASSQNLFNNILGGGLLGYGTGGFGLSSLFGGGGGLSGNAMYAMLSDIRTKENVRPMGKNALAAVLNLEPTEYRYKPEFGGTQELGFVADQVEKVYPEAVVRGPGGLKMVKPMAFNALLVGAIKEQQEELKALKRSKRHG